MVRKKKGSSINFKFLNVIVVALVLLVLSKFTNYLNYSNNDTNEKSFVEINENIVFKIEGENNKLDINNADIKEIANILDNKKASSVIAYREFVGFIDNIDYIKGISVSDKSKLKENFTISSEEGQYIKRNINDLSKNELQLLGFNSKEIKYIIELKSKGAITSDIDLKRKVNKAILEKYIVY